MIINGKEIRQNLYNYNIYGDRLDIIKGIITSLNLKAWFADVIDDSCDDIGATMAKRAENIEDFEENFNGMLSTMVWIEGYVGRKKVKIAIRYIEDGIQVTCGDALKEFFDEIGEEA